MQKTRSWQDSFDRLELARRNEGVLRDDELRQVRDAETAYAKATAEEAGTVAAKGFMLAGDSDDAAALPVKPKPKPKAKSATRKPPQAKRTAPRRATKAGKPKAAKPKTAKPRATKPRVAKPRSAPASAAPPPVIAVPLESPPPAAEALLITPLPRSASLARYRKPGLFGLIGSWLRLAARRTRMPAKLHGPVKKDVTPHDDLAALKAENEKLRRQLEVLLARQAADRADSPPWLTTPAGEVPARPRRRSA